MGNVTHYARVWLNISADLRTFLQEGKLHNHMAWLQQVYNCAGTHAANTAGTIKHDWFIVEAQNPISLLSVGSLLSGIGLRAKWKLN